MRVNAVADVGDLAGATIIAGALEGLEPLPGSDEILDSFDRSHFEATGFEGKSGQVVTLPYDPAHAVVLVGVGEEASFDSVRAASGNATRQVDSERAVSFLAGAGFDGSTRAAVEGALLGGYSYQTYKTDSSDTQVESIDFVGADAEELEEASVAAEATNLARDWVNTPARDKSPETYAALIETAAVASGVSAEVWDLPRIEQEELGGLLGVAAGSDRQPRCVILTYTPQDAVAHLALVGKGITFDSGGLSIKPASSMMEMKDDMSGSAIVAAATIAIARLGLPIRVTCITPLTDNAIGGDATRPGDVLRPLEGPTIEVLNTDAEGRLILADGLGLAKRFEPDLTVDVATLTGAARVALGDKVAAVFGSDSDVSDRVLAASSRAGEDFWEMPLYKGYRSSIDSDIADIKNISGSRYGGAIVAALFLAEYAGDGPWAHLDVAGPARTRETTGEQVKGASGVGVRTLIELARDLSETP